MERIIHKNIKSYLSEHNFITSSQHGFQMGRSPCSNLLEYVSDWILGLDSGDNFDVLYIDFSKAFDTVVHARLLLKLSWYGICDNLLCFIKS